jgi:hypothetical protein
MVRNQKTGQTWTEPADHVVANVTVQNLVQLLGEDAPQGYARRVRSLPPASGAFVVYLGVDARAIPAGCPPHLQFLYDYDGPIGENNSLFVSVSRPGDGRAPTGQATIIASSFTDLAAWERGDYAARKQAYTDRRSPVWGSILICVLNISSMSKRPPPAPLPTSPPAIAARWVGWGCG